MFLTLFLLGRRKRQWQGHLYLLKVNNRTTTKSSSKLRVENREDVNSLFSCSLMSWERLDSDLKVNGMKHFRFSHERHILAFADKILRIASCSYARNLADTPG